jgi:hypothetical protein
MWIFPYGERGPALRHCRLKIHGYFERFFTNLEISLSISKIFYKYDVIGDTHHLPPLNPPLRHAWYSRTCRRAQKSTSHVLWNQRTQQAWVVVKSLWDYLKRRSLLTLSVLTTLHPCVLNQFHMIHFELDPEIRVKPTCSQPWHHSLK